jgi:anti-sigma factor RsiW
MKCKDAKVLMHGLVDCELDAGHVHDVEAHLAVCPHCAAALARTRDLCSSLKCVDLGHHAPPHLEARIQAALKGSRKP